MGYAKAPSDAAFNGDTTAELLIRAFYFADQNGGPTYVLHVLLVRRLLCKGQVCM